jgi:transcription-repair coupling factor (superfamily II helicase)
MTLQELVQLYALAPAVEVFRKQLEDSSVHSIYLDGLVASSAPMLFAAVANSQQQIANSQLFILSDEDEAGYFYHDLRQMLGEADPAGMERVMFFPSSYRRAIKYAQRDAANEILRTEVLAQLSSATAPFYIVTYPEAMAEQVISQQQLSERTLVLQQGQTVEIDQIAKTLRGFGFQEVDYVYEPGQFAQRGSILDVYSFSSEYPFRIDFFGDDIDSIRTFEVDNQLSRDKKAQISIIPELTKAEQSVTYSSFFSFLKKDSRVKSSHSLSLVLAENRAMMATTKGFLGSVSGCFLSKPGFTWLSVLLSLPTSFPAFGNRSCDASAITAAQ